MRKLIQPPKELRRKGVHCSRLLGAIAVPPAFDTVEFFRNMQYQKELNLLGVVSRCCGACAVFRLFPGKLCAKPYRHAVEPENHQSLRTRRIYKVYASRSELQSVILTTRARRE